MHSSILAEPLAHICGMAIGIGVYYAAGFVTQDIRARIKAGMIASSFCNLIVGGHINLLAKDFISLLLLRPISAYAGAKLFEIVGESLGAPHASGSHA
jgi:hypothetical protein